MKQKQITWVCKKCSKHFYLTPLEDKVTVNMWCQHCHGRMYRKDNGSLDVFNNMKGGKS